jgi:hypothetical protein
MDSRKRRKAKEGFYMQEEVTQKTVTLCIQTTKLTADVLKKAMGVYLEHRGKKKTAKAATGKISVKDLAKQKGGMKNIEITPKNIKSFERCARKYGINYALRKDKSKEPPVYMVFFKAKDEDAISAAFRDFTRKELKKANKPSIHDRLKKFRDFVLKNFPAKSRKKHREASL